MAFKRWFVVFSHDQSPVDGHVYINKAQAISAKNSMKNPILYNVVKMQIAVVN